MNVSRIGQIHPTVALGSISPDYRSSRYFALLGGAMVYHKGLECSTLPVSSLPHTPVGSQTVIVGLAPVLVVAASR